MLDTQYLSNRRDRPTGVAGNYRSARPKSLQQIRDKYKNIKNPSTMQQIYGIFGNYARILAYIRC